MGTLDVMMMIMLFLVVGGCPRTQCAPVSSQVLREVLGAFKQAISDPRDVLASWDTFNQSSNPCTSNWTGLHCESSTASGNSTMITITNISIALTNQSLQGSITPELSRLSGALTSLDLSYNSLSGSITFLSNFSTSGDASLQTLILDYNHLHGLFTLPPSCFSHLTSLSVAENSLSGPLPSEALSRCPSLQLLNVSNNLFTGPLFPAGLGNLTTTISSLDAGRNNLSGPIPPSVGNCSMLTFLSLTYNNLSGAMPPSFGVGCPNLAFLSLFNNRLSGHLPLEMGLLSKLSYLSIGLNSFSGEVLHILANCSALSVVDISQMSFTGAMPVDFGSQLPRLTVLAMEFNMFTGTISESLGNCSGLNYLLLGFNHNISGVIPPALFQAQHISQLDLQFNSLSGNIPPEIKNLTSLQKTFLNNNKFTGSLPEEMAMLASLQVLTLEHNFLSGNFPNQLFSCTNLLGLSLHDNSLAGSISSDIGRLLDLGSFDASNNKLTGQIPLGLSSLKKLQAISLSNNNLSGEIPKTVIAGLLGCNYFNVSHNSLSGPIPDAEFSGKLQYLETLDLSHNKLSGAVPSGLAQCPDLQFVNFSQNTLSGPIPSSFGLSFQNLVELNLSHNSINGSIPTILSGLKSLQRLDLSYNVLSGTIPSALAQVKSLQYLNMSYNSQLEGVIPTGGVFINLTSTSFLGDHMLCGATINVTCAERDNHSLSKATVIAIAVAGSLLLLSLGFLVMVVLYRKAATRHLASDWDFSPYRRFTLEDIQQATGNFSEDNIIGSGVTGTVYKGILKDGTTLAFKKFKVDNSSMQSFATELVSVRFVRHRNLARIMGYCSNWRDTSILILEYMPNGSLENHLHGRRDQVDELSWDARVRVAISVAHGLIYLHNYSPAPIIHCDLKPENILFDADMETRITDFGLAKVMASAATSSFTDNMQGTIGYMAPELASYGHISRKCDVYSYGVLLMEMITGRRPFEEVDMKMQLAGEEDQMQETKTLVQWVASMFEANEIKAMLDKPLQEARMSDNTDRGDIEIEQMKRFLALALQCTHENPRQRPTMQEVVQTLSSTITAPLTVKSKEIQDLLSPSQKFAVKDPKYKSFSSGP